MAEKPFKNCLRGGDEVFDTVTKKIGVVAASPWATKRNVSVRFVPALKAERLDVMKLRLVVDGKPEDTPPIEGDPDSRSEVQIEEEADALSILKIQRAELKAQMETMNGKFKVMSDRLMKMDEAIKILS